MLHGTTNSHKEILVKSTLGCHKVNVAGDLLKTYIESLPNYIPFKYKNFTPESKYFMPEIIKQKNNFTRKEKIKIKSNISKKSLDLMKSLNSPFLTNRDKSYFHRFSYKFPEEIIDLILSSYKSSKSELLNKFSESPKRNLFFSPSMIEVSFEENFCDKVDALINLGTTYFHIDVGDGKFISRKFSGIEKISYLVSLNKSLNIHTHLMVEEPLDKITNNESYIDTYIKAGSSAIALHKRSFKSVNKFKKAVDHIKKNNCKPGLIIEITDNELKETWELIKYLNLKWVVIMGVPIGYGGQLFQSSCLKKINYLRKRSVELTHNSLDIEVDGGLNFSNLIECKKAGANIFAGWSIIKGNSKDLILDNYSKILGLLKSE